MAESHGERDLGVGRKRTLRKGLRAMHQNAGFSGSRESAPGAGETMKVTPEARKNAPELSESPFTAPLKSGDRVTTAAQEQPSSFRRLDGNGR